ncbi:hypothetical protein LIER_29931 [Lithospermum erythrorhizon]|uniref:Uncharacterized protein n=1 Tax=Lithospermum erythrorhizon TaxID=34254 RepID=A0AAV3RKT2_LITER
MTLLAPTKGVITISPKLMQGTHIADIPLAIVDTGGALESGTDETPKIIRDEMRHLDGVIQTSLARKSVWEAYLRSLSGAVDPVVDPGIGGTGAEAPQTGSFYVSFLILWFCFWDK